MGSEMCIRDRILVIDDEEAILELVKRGLEKEGFAVDTLTSAKKVDVSKLRQYNLLILDVMMPKMNGWQVCREIRKYSKVPIIMLTAKSSEDDELTGLCLLCDQRCFDPKLGNSGVQLSPFHDSKQSSLSLP